MATANTDASKARDNLTRSFADNRLMPLLFGEHDKHLIMIEDRLGVEITPRGNNVAIKGNKRAALSAANVLDELYHQIESGRDITIGDVEGSIRMNASNGKTRSNGDGNANHDVQIITRRKTITPRSPGQSRYIRAILRDELVFGVGPAGTGKSYLAVACAAAALNQGLVDRIVFSRPAVEAGENLGFLPGDMKEKVDPYLRPLYDALYDVMPANLITKGLSDGTIEIAPLAFMRGRTLSSSFVILDEAQNTTQLQMKMFLTRLGENSRMVINGDPSQVDLPKGVTSGLSHATSLLEDIKGISIITLGEDDIVRHPLVSKIVNAYGRD